MGANVLKKSPSEVLADNLAQAGDGIRPKECSAHHIIPFSDKRGAMAREVLKKCKIDINSALNGVYLPSSSEKAQKLLDQMMAGGATTACTGAAVHSKLHTDDYYKFLSKDIGDAKKEDLAEEGIEIGEEEKVFGQSPACITVRWVLKVYKQKLRLGQITGMP